VSVRRPRLEKVRQVFWRLVREPLVHFLILGVVLFAGITGVRALERPTVSIDAQDVNQLIEYWQLQSQRPPTKAELAAIIQERVDEELLAREAQRLGMDKGDLIIRRRLAQKMAFASEDLGDLQPTTATLRADYEKTKAQYGEPAKIAFRQVFFSADRGVNAARAAATKALALARQGKSDLGGDPFLLPLTYADASPDTLARDYGTDFAKLVADAPPGRWAGPVQSPFGFHIVRVESRTAPETPPFEEVQDRVRENYLAAQRRIKNEAFLQKLRQKYRVEIAGATP
jgi:peptidyl-prolyl cis-trans isomerase C